MTEIYSTYQAKTHFTEVIRRVRGGGRVVITYHGIAVAEVRPIEADAPSLEGRLARLAEEGVVIRPVPGGGDLEPLARRPGGLSRFLAERE